MRVLVTGGAGYIGSHAARELARRGHTVRIYDNLSTGHRELCAGFELITGDVGDSGAVSAALDGVDAVMHFAAAADVGESVANPQKYFQNNVSAGLRLLDAVVAAGVRYFIFSSSCSVYGHAERQPIAEDVPLCPVSPYGYSKLAFEHALQAYAVAYGLRFVSLRYFNAAGAALEGGLGEWHDPEPHLIPRVLQAAAGLRPAIEIYGKDYPTPDGTCIRDYIHVDDLARAHLAALEYLAAGNDSAVLNLGTGEGRSVRQVITAVETITGQPVKRSFASRRPGDPAMLVADPCRAQALLGWHAQHGLDDIIRTAWAWLQSRYPARTGR